MVISLERQIIQSLFGWLFSRGLHLNSIRCKPFTVKYLFSNSQVSTGFYASSVPLLKSEPRTRIMLVKLQFAEWKCSKSGFIYGFHLLQIFNLLFAFIIQSIVSLLHKIHFKIVYVSVRSMKHRFCQQNAVPLCNFSKLDYPAKSL